jgi:hypothetical protein
MNRAEFEADALHKGYEIREGMPGYSCWRAH